MLTLNKTDDCLELQKLRKYRDNWLRNQNYGEEIIREYYLKSQILVNNIDKSKNAKDIYKSIWDNHLNHIIESIDMGNHSKALQLYKEMVHSLSTKYLA